MALNVAQVVGQIKANVGKSLRPDSILNVCRLLNISFRKRILDPVTTIHVFLLQILHGNIACTGLTHLAGITFSATAYCKARSSLPLLVFEILLEKVIDSLLPSVEHASRWHGHRTWLMDGSTFSMPDTPELQKEFGQPGAQKKGCGFPVAHLLALFHASTGILQKVIVAPMRTHDMKQAALMHPEMQENDILLADRGFSSYAHLALLVKRKMHAVFRCHQKQIVDFTEHRPHTGRRKPSKGKPRSRWLKRLGKDDQLVEYIKPTTRPKWMSEEEYASLPETLVVRELRYTIAQPGRRTRVITLVTTLLDPVLYPATDLAELYGQRWGVEVHLRDLKTTMKMEVLHCKTVEGVKKELMMFALAYNLVRMVMLEASRRQNEPVDRISFVDVLRWLRTAEPGTPLPKFVVNPHRPKRYESRVVKRRPKPFDLMNKPRPELRKALAEQEVAA